jgi:PASTA domain
MEIAGKIVDENRSPVSGAKVRVFRNETEILGGSSSPEGTFVLADEIDYTGSHLKVVVDCRGFQRLERRIEPQGEYLRLELKREKVRVPNVVNKSYSQALAELRSQSFRGIENKALGKPPWDTVISQNPVAGTIVNPGTNVTLDIRVAPAKIAVPNLLRNRNVGRCYGSDLKAELVGFALKVAECPFLKEFFIGFLADFDVILTKLEHTID